MVQAIVTEKPATSVVEPSVSAVSWAAVVAGAIASCALTLVLLSFGTGVGFAVVSPWGHPGVSTTTFEIGTGLYFIVDGDDFVGHRRLLCGSSTHQMDGPAYPRSLFP